jgi:hypothetical protein
MAIDPEILAVLLRHLEAIHTNDIETYHATTSADLTLYEWYVTPHRLDGLPFHDFMLAENARRGTVFGAPAEAGQHNRFDLANLHIQRYDDTAIACYTLLISAGLPEGVRVTAHNESRVLIRQDGLWKVVHVHKSPAWDAPHVPPPLIG